MSFMKARLEELSMGYDLDSGGYEFEVAPKGLEAKVHCVVWEDPDPDYIPWCVGDASPATFRGWYGLSCPLYAFAPGGGSVEWPAEFETEEYTFALVREGVVLGSEHECHCEGQSRCLRCDDTGYVNSEGGAWAVYAIKQEDTDE